MRVSFRRILLEYVQVFLWDSTAESECIILYPRQQL